MSASSIQFTFFLTIPTPQRIQRVMLAAPRAEPIGEPEKVLFIDLIEDLHHCLLDDLVLQGRNAQGTLSTVGFRYVGSLGRLRLIRSAMDSAMQVCQLLIQIRLVLFPCHAVYSRRSIPLQSLVAVPQQINRDVVK